MKVNKNKNHHDFYLIIDSKTKEVAIFLNKYTISIVKQITKFINHLVEYSKSIFVSKEEIHKTFNSSRNKSAQSLSLKNCVHLAMKGFHGTPIDKKSYQKIHRIWDGRDFYTPILERLHEALKLELSFAKDPNLKKSKEFLEVERIVLHRSILHDFSRDMKNINANLDKVANNVADLVDSLDIKQSIEKKGRAGCRVVPLEDGSQSFSIPGGSTSHAIIYEFKKEADGSYSFIIHNRGKGLKDSELHGSYFFQKGRKTYRKTSVCISIPKESKGYLKDKDFIKALIIAYKNGDSMEHPYSIIKKQLLQSGVGSLVISKQEKIYQAYDHFIQSKLNITDLKAKIQELRTTQNALKKLLKETTPKKAKELRKQITQIQQERDILKHILRTYNKNSQLSKKAILKTLNMVKKSVLMQDPNYHSVQKWGTCTESCLTLSDKKMASKNVLRKLKFEALKSAKEDLDKLISSDKFKESEKINLLVQSEFFGPFRQIVSYNAKEDAKFISEQAQSKLDKLHTKITKP